MSFGELCIVAIVAIVIMKPEDLPVIISKFKYARKYIARLKAEIVGYFDEQLQIDDKELEKDVHEINLYLKKIISLNGSYDGDYSLEDIKDKYKQLVKQKINHKKDQDKV